VRVRQLQRAHDGVGREGRGAARTTLAGLNATARRRRRESERASQQARARAEHRQGMHTYRRTRSSHRCAPAQAPGWATGRPAGRRSRRRRRPSRHEQCALPGEAARQPAAACGAADEARHGKRAEHTRQRAAGASGVRRQRARRRDGTKWHSGTARASQQQARAHCKQGAAIGGARARTARQCCARCCEPARGCSRAGAAASAARVTPASRSSVAAQIHILESKPPRRAAGARAPRGTAAPEWPT
jgi:hypothetical protein